MSLAISQEGVRLLAERVLIIEDDDSNRELFQMVLKEDGYEVVCVGSGEQAICLLETDHNFVAALVDIGLPGIDGVEVVRAMQGSDATKGITTILVTASRRGDVDDIGNGFLCKPLDINGLKGAIEEGVVKSVLRCLVSQD